MSHQHIALLCLCPAFWTQLFWLRNLTLGLGHQNYLYGAKSKVGLLFQALCILQNDNNNDATLILHDEKLNTCCCIQHVCLIDFSSLYFRKQTFKKGASLIPIYIYTHIGFGSLFKIHLRYRILNS